MKLRLADDLLLPVDAATESFAVLGRRGSGKTHTVVVLVEEMLKAGIPVVVIDPLDVWWGLRVSKDGKREGFPIYVAGGSHLDIPLSADSGKVLADAVVDQGLSIILSTRHLSKSDQRRFVGEFCERLYDRKADPTHRTALHVVIDEADAFVPQRLMPGAERCFGAVDTLVRRGRSSGLAVTLISQRPQVINKDVLSQTEVLVAHQLTGPQDRKALQAWIEANDDANRSAEFMGALASLPKGRAWFWSPGLLKIFKPVDVRDRETFDSSATPKPGVAGVKPRAFAAVDLEKLTKEIAATIEKAKADDPRELRKQVAELRAELAKKQVAIAHKQQNVAPKRVEVLTDADRQLLGKLFDKLFETQNILGKRTADLVGGNELKLSELVRSILEEFDQKFRALQDKTRAEFEQRLDSKGFQKILAKLSALSLEPKAHHIESTLNSHRIPPPAVTMAVTGRLVAQVGTTAGGPLSKMQRAMLIALAQHPDGLTKKQILIHACYSSNGATSAVFAEFVREGWVDVPAAASLRITERGLGLLGAYDPLPIGDELRAFLLSGDRLSEMERRILTAICDPYPRDISKGDVLALAKYSSNGATSATFAKLVALGYAQRGDAAGRLKAADELFG